VRPTSPVLWELGEGNLPRLPDTARTRTAPWSATAPRCRDAHPRSHAARPLPAWRERPQPWPRARSQTRSDLVVAHATFLRLSASSPTARPRAAKSAARSMSSTTPTRYFSYGVVWRVDATESRRVGQTKHGTSRGNTSRGGTSPLGSPSCLGDGDQGGESWWMPGMDGTLRA
jgi:hypothetical protein